MMFAVILAGGRGERFWPLSRAASPKQFLNITGSLTLIQNTVKRIKKFIPEKQIFIVTNRQYAVEIKKQLVRLGVVSVNILLEPEPKNTAPAIAWAAKIIYERDKNADLIILPSDHFIKNENKFNSLVKKAFLLARENRIVTFGVRPTGIQVGYGYLKVRPKVGSQSYYSVEKFIEKPPLNRAKGFIKSKNYFWNCGIFVAKVGYLLDEFKRLTPGIYSNLDKLQGTNVVKSWKKMPAISIDYAIIEKVNPDKVIMFDASGTGWSDVGSLSALKDLHDKDSNGNILRGDALDLDSRNIVVWGHKRLVTTIGLKDLIVIDTDDALLVCNANKCQNVKDMVEKIRNKGRSEHLVKKEIKFIASR